MSVACLAVGSRVAYDGGVWMVVGFAGDRVTVQEHGSGRTLSLRIATLLAAPGGRVIEGAWMRRSARSARRWRA